MYIETIINKIKTICYSCGLLTFVEKSSTWNMDTKLILKFLSSSLIILSDLNIYLIINRKYQFASSKLSYYQIEYFLNITVLTNYLRLAVNHID